MKNEIDTYLSGIPAERKDKLEAIRKAFLNSADGLRETMKYKMPTYEKGSGWVCIGNQKKYISVYFCSAELIENIRKKHPDIDTGKGCVRIKDHQQVPLADLVSSFKKAMQAKKLR